MKRKRGSYYVPEEIKREILLRLPVKSLVRFRSIDKRFKSLISTQKFITDHLKAVRCQEDKLILLLGKGRSKQPSCFVFLDGLIPKHVEDIRLDEETFKYSKVIMVGYCNGLVCLICHSRRRSTRELMFVNPCTKKVVVIPASDHLSRHISSPIFGFGYAEDDEDYKLVVFPSTFKSSGVPSTAKVFSLRTRNWGTVVCAWSQPQDPQNKYWEIASKRPVFVDGALHWLAKDFDVNGRYSNFVLSFSLSRDHKIRKFALPRCLCITLHVYDGRLSVFVRDQLWVLNKCTSTWITILKGVILRKILGFSGGVGVVFSQKIWLEDCTDEELRCYDPRTQKSSPLEKNHGDKILSPFRLYAYRQTLALLD